MRVSESTNQKNEIWKSHHLLPSAALDHRLALLDEIIALTVTELSRQRNYRC